MQVLNHTNKLYKNAQKAAELIINSLPNRSLKEQSLKETPQRFAKMLLEQLEGEFYTNEDIIKSCGKVFDYDGQHDDNFVIVDNIQCFSHCEHHIALMYNMSVDIGYKPNDKILGLSKFARIVHLVSSRLQTQEKMGSDIMQILKGILGEVPIIIRIRAEHSCMTARGIKKPNSYTQTIHTNIHTVEQINTFLEMVGK